MTTRQKPTDVRDFKTHPHGERGTGVEIGTGVERGTEVRIDSLNLDPEEIASRSRRIAEKLVPGDSLEDRVRQRCVIATADPDFAKLLEFKNSPVEAGIQAILEGRTIFTDIRMVQTGIIKKGHTCQVKCALDHTNPAAQLDSRKTTRTSAGFNTLAEEIENSIVVIGNAPSAALKVHQIAANGIKPALIIATPVGFVNANLSKEKIRELKIPNITTKGMRGGTPIAVAAINEIITQTTKRKPGN